MPKVDEERNNREQKRLKRALEAAGLYTFAPASPRHHAEARIMQSSSTAAHVAELNGAYAVLHKAQQCAHRCIR